MTIRYPDLHEATAALVAAAMAELAAFETVPVLIERTGQDGWRRSSQETLLVVQRRRWEHPWPLSSPEWWDTLPPMKRFRTVLAGHPDLHRRVDTLIGFGFSASLRQLTRVLIVNLLTPLIEASGLYTFDRAAFDVVYEQVETGLLADHVRLVQAVPLLGFHKTHDLDVPLDDGFVVRLMTDTELSAAVETGLPGQATSSTTTRSVSRYHQYALVKVSTYPLHIGAMTGSVPPPPPIDEEAQRLQIAMRLICGGSVTLGRPFQMQHPDDFDAASGCSASLTWSQPPALDRPTLLSTREQADSVQEMMTMLTATAVTRDRSLQMAIRRLVSSGSRGLPEDRLIDLMIAAEALFIHGADLSNNQKKKAQIAPAAANLLDGDPELGIPREAISRFMNDAYIRRNHETHADPDPPMQAGLLDGNRTADLPPIVEDLERIMRRALALKIREISSTSAAARLPKRIRDFDAP